MIRKRRSPFIRDTYLAYLIKGARLTEPDGFPIIEDWMVTDIIPEELFQWDRRRDITNPSNSGISFYCQDVGFTGVLSNPKNYVDILKKYQVVIGPDASPYTDMPLVVQKSQIFLNLSITYYWATEGIPIIPNIRVGDMRTMNSLDAYPKHTLIAIGTNGFIKSKENRTFFAEQVKIIVQKLEPTGILVYGKDCNDIFKYPRQLGMPIYQYDSYTMKENAKEKKEKLEVLKHEG